MDFENNGTRDKPASEYTSKGTLIMTHKTSSLAAEFLAIPKGAQNGVKNGLQVLLDVEAFEYAYFPRYYTCNNPSMANMAHHKILSLFCIFFR